MNIWLLTDIAGAAGSKVHLDYTIATPSIPGGTGVSIDLKTVSYNPSPVAGESCYKHAVTLNYDSNASAPLSTFVLGGAIVARMHKLSTVEVRARSSCSATAEVQRTYQLSYSTDRDTGQSRLSSATMTGRAGTPEGSVKLPVATYSYGSASNGTDLTYHKASSPALGFSALGDTSFVDNEFQTRSMLLDLTGDGRPDLVSLSTSNVLSARKNKSAVDGISFDQGLTQLQTQWRSPESVVPMGDREYTWRQVIDVNGDGRMDLLDAFEMPGNWVVYFNTPDRVDPTIIRWKRWQFPIAPMVKALSDRGMTIPGNFLPLSRRMPSGDFVQDPTLCWIWVPVDEAWERIPEDDANCPEAPLIGELHRTTIVEWEVRDVNGDGYPDFVFNSSPVVFARRTTPFPANPRDWEEVAQTKVTYPTLVVTNRVDAMLNVAGIRSPDAPDPSKPNEFGPWFSDPITLISRDQCGVAQWATGDGASAPFQSQPCGFEDVNGDGIVDRVNDRSVFLGKGTPSSTGWFTSGAAITLPGSLVVHQNARALNCSIPGATTYSASQFAGLRDLTGDGIPDYVFKDGSGAVAVRIGTGTGFGSPRAVNGPFELSLQTERCDGTSSTTFGGLFDIDGDGKPDVVSSAEVWLLVGPSGAPGAPEAGRLTQIDNGYGAQTNIHYRSIKADPGLHQVPFPEIVVDSVSTTGTRGQGGDLSATSYAYDGAQLLFDPAADAFTFRGYRRRLELPAPVSQPTGVAALVITDYGAPISPADPYGLASGALDRDARHARYLGAGRVSEITVLSGDFGADNLANPSRLLSIDVTKDSRRIGHAQYDWRARVLTDSSDPAGPEPCLEMVYPYDYVDSLNYARNADNHAYDACTVHGFAYVSAVDSWRSDPGAAPPSSSANVETKAEVKTIDDLGRPVKVAYFNDVHQPDDDICVVTEYATKTGANERVLFAPASRTVSACDTTTIYARETWEYDGQASGVGAGLVTSHSVERRDDIGVLLATIRQFDATYDAAGNPKTVTATRDDQATRTVAVEYDTFGLALTKTTVTADDGPTLQTSITRDQVTLNATSVTEPNGTQYGTEFDGFNRVTRSTVTPPGGSPGVLSTFKYFGFSKTAPAGECIANKTLRCVVTKAFPDPVASSDVDSAAGHIGTAFFDELGRPYRSEVQLGADFPGKKLVTSSRVYDGLGRVLVDREPFAVDGGAADPPTYTTTYYFNADGTPSCFVRGTEKQAYTEASDETNQIFPTCFRRTFENNTEVVKVKDAASLLSHSPQDGVEQRSYVTAVGRTLERSTWQGSTRLEYATFTYDPLGRRTSMKRYQDAAGGTKPVVSSWHFDSLGQVTELDEPDSVPQYSKYSSWGELLETYRSVISAGGTTIKRSVVKQYDALGRVMHSEERTDNVADPDTLYDYLYDEGVNIAPQVTPTNMLGRLAQASSPTGTVSFSYDALGAINARVFTEPQGNMYVEKHIWHADGSPSALELYLPDTAFAKEHVDYTYDSAGHNTTVKYSAADNQDLFVASTIDLLGRVREAKFGLASYTAAYDPGGRRLLTQVAVSSPLGSRTYNFPDYDPVGRERSRSEVKDGTTRTTTFAYDALGRLSSSVQTAGTTTFFDQHFTYDPLGNLLTRSDAKANFGPTSTTVSYLDTDRDRICRIAFGSDSATACNVTYDEVGSILSQPTPTGSRQYTYYLDGSTRTITDDHGSTAHFHYDALGGVQTLDLTSSISPDQRQDIHLGDLLVRRNANTPNEFLVRNIPTPDGSIASRRGAGGPWIFAFGEPRGNRFFVDANGAFVQNVDYDSFGTPNSTGAQPGTKTHTPEQWNGGDALAAFGISQLGARLYDPTIGRFLSRDPLLIPRTSATTNPYAFALNDPINASDPSGLDYQSDCTNCPASDNSGGGTHVTSFTFEGIGDPFVKAREHERRSAEANKARFPKWQTVLFGYGIGDYFDDQPVEVQQAVALTMLINVANMIERRKNPTLRDMIEDKLTDLEIALWLIPVAGAEARIIRYELEGSIRAVFAAETRSTNEIMELVKARDALYSLLKMRSRQLALGTDPIRGYIAAEGVGGVHIEQMLRRTISRSADVAVDFVDSALGPISLKGPLPATGNPAGLALSAIRDANFNTATRTLFVDLSGLSSEQMLLVERQVTAGTKTSRKVVIFLK